MKSLAIASIFFLCACGDRVAKNVPPKYAEIAEFHHATCGNCHTRVEPGERTRAQFEAAMSRHHARVKLTDAEWALLVDYLSETP
jgi:FAD/FMN-containing dehydrogenase